MSASEVDISDIVAIPVLSTILDVICQTTGMGFAAVARVTDGRWIACTVRDDINFGLKSGGELKVDTTICHEIRQSGNAVVIENVGEDAVYCDHLTPALYGFKSYISMPIFLKDGSFFGTLCAIDPHPRSLKTDATIGMFKLFAELVSFHLNAVERLKVVDHSLRAERQTGALREQFVAVLAHDLRNPLGAISSAAMLLNRMQIPERALTLAQLIQDSAARMTGLIENMLDFARGRRGSGLAVNKSDDAPLEAALRQIIDELRAGHPGTDIDASFSLDEPVHCDVHRIAQLCSNVLGNALTYGQAGKPVSVKAFTRAGEFELAISNEGKKIPDDVVRTLFDPFVRGESKSTHGLGLGLYIAQEIARAHEGRLDVVSTDEKTCFTLRMPVSLPNMQLEPVSRAG